MKEHYEQIPIEDSPWIDKHSSEDVLNYKEYLRGLGAPVADLLLSRESNAANSFLTGAGQALRRFNITTRTHKVTSSTTFRFSELKEKITTVFIVADAGRINAQKGALGLLQWCALTELKRHPDRHVPVTYLADEATNYRINDLSSFLSWARGYGIKIHLIFQFISEFRNTYSSETLKTLLNAAEVTQFLPGQSEPEVLELIQKRLGEKSVITENHQSGGVFGGVHSTSYAEASRPLMTSDEIERCKKTILFIRQNKPMLVDLPPIAAISPFRKQIDPDPAHGGKPFLRRIKLRLEGRDGPLLWRIIAPRIGRLLGKLFSKTHERKSK